MAESNMVKVSDVNMPQFSVDFASDIVRENLPAEKRMELAVIAQNRRLDLAEDIAQRTVRLQASRADMEHTLSKAKELSQVKGDFVIRSCHDTASGQTEITVRRHCPVIYIIFAIAGLIFLLWLMK
jgi:hypothetical protein